MCLAFSKSAKEVQANAERTGPENRLQGVDFRTTTS